MNRFVSLKYCECNLSDEFSRGNSRRGVDMRLVSTLVALLLFFTSAFSIGSEKANSKVVTIDSSIPSAQVTTQSAQKKNFIHPQSEKITSGKIQYQRDFVSQGKNYTMYYLASKRSKSDTWVEDIYFVPEDYKPYIVSKHEESAPPKVLHFIYHDLAENMFLGAKTTEVKYDNGKLYRIEKEIPLPYSIGDEVSRLISGNSKFKTKKEFMDKLAFSDMPDLLSTKKSALNSIANNGVQNNSNGNTTSGDLKKYCTPVTRENINGTTLYKTSGREKFVFMGVHQKTPISGRTQEYSIIPSLYLMKNQNEQHYMFNLEVMFLGTSQDVIDYLADFIGNKGDNFLLECGNLTVYGQGTGTVPQQIVFELTDYHESKIPYMGGKEVKLTNTRTGKSIYLGTWLNGELKLSTYSSIVKNCLTTMFDLIRNASK